jgi:Cu-Zn family superoxide dismutase
MLDRSRAVFVALGLLAACADAATAPASAATALPSLAAAPAAARAVDARLHDAAGQDIGFVRLVEDATGRVHLTAHAQGLTPGLHGMHLHAVGACNGATSPAFASAGGHFNPTAREHGHHNPNGAHAGDLPNLVVNEAGVGRLSTRLEQFAIAALLDADGTALVLHQNADDQLTNAGPLGPGNSGARIACGVLRAR